MTGVQKYQKWEYHPSSAAHSLILPDGCRDVIIHHDEANPCRVILTDLDFTPRCVWHASHTAMTGYRLRPGTTVSDTALRAIAERSADAEQILESEQLDHGSIDTVIAALADTAETISSVVRNSGTSSRTLQRQFSKLGLPAPEYWRLLGRARRAAQLLASPARLTEIAAGSGYSDQAHMTREFKRWFGKSPARLRQDQDAIETLIQPALGNWTGEQISIR